MSGRSSFVAVLVAFFVGVIGALSLKPAAVVDEVDGASNRPGVRGRVPAAFGTNLPTLGENALEVAARIAHSSGDRLLLEIFDPGEVVPAFEIVDAVDIGFGFH